MVIEMDPSLPRRVDFLPILRLQGVAIPKQEIGTCVCTTTVQEPFKEYEHSAEFGTLLRNDGSNTRLTFTLGTPSVIPEVTYKPSEIIENISDALGGLTILAPGVEDILVKQMGAKEPLPRGVPQEGPLDGVNDIYTESTARGNHNKMFRQRTGVPVANPFTIASQGLRAHRMAPTEHLAKRLRSVLEVTNVVGLADDRRVYRDELGRTNMGGIQMATALAHWNQDVGTPVTIEAAVNAHRFGFRMLRLTKSQECIVL